MPYLLFFALLPRLITAGSVSKEQLNPVRRNSYPITPAVDESLLAIQIGGIVGAYVIFVAVLLSLLLFVGRRLRRAVLSSNYSLHVEMMKPVKPPPSMDPSPVTPISVNLPSPGPRSFSRSWSSLGKGSRSHASGTTTSVATIDESVVATDRQRAQEDLEMLYAAVMEHDAQKEAAAAARGANQDSSDGDEAVAAAAEKEIPSPDSIPTNPFTDRSSHVSSNNSPLMSPRSSGRLSRISSLSLFNLKSQNQNQSSSNSNSSKLRSPRPFPLRKLSISSPVASPSFQADQPPLTPRHYNPPPRPPAPPLPVATPAIAAQKQQQPSLPQINTQPPPLPTPRLEPPRAKERSPRGPVPPPLTLTTPTGSNTTHHGRSPSSSLPFRDAYPLQSAPATKLTVLERPMKQLNGPRTGMPTPYSPYMPFTPVTPLTPSSMITKRQRRRAEKESGLKVLNEDDLVRDDGDMWGY
ncbi:uncharacterized protein BO88DRAFT_408316 [Aspergillus vadensis CBS 113365]|uniref:Uncharacterized protein n=1 Tax=Aspergillus vadensis (strain CBS 113365 / IMI 142717 / IBT 24658) TaxID=1448311 RepID=A0A319BFG0_ASPVC|nr:hypothetical protein BO88DRAFT_408316 [Aspergillus vadensis CBS 113365]PYH64663.1 hypothetical protein BO88DRAFT_408316 [Aspergillus vadensis CBS 113365]